MYKVCNCRKEGNKGGTKYEIRLFLYEIRLIRLRRKTLNLHNHETL